MSDEAKALVERLRVLHVWPQAVADGHADLLTARQIEKLCEVGRVSHEAADLIETQAREIKRLRLSGGLLLNFAGHDNDCRSHKLMGCNCGYTDVWKMWRAALGERQ